MNAARWVSPKKANIGPTYQKTFRFPWHRCDRPASPQVNSSRLTPKDPGMCAGAIDTRNNPSFAKMTKQSAKLMKRIIRRQCRRMYGKGWCKCSNDVKEFRKIMAVIQIDKKSRRRARSNDTNATLCKSNNKHSRTCGSLHRADTSTTSSTTTRSRSSRV